MNGQLSTSLRKELVDLENIDLVGIISVILVAWVLIIIIRRPLPYIVSRLPARFRHHILPVIPVLRLAVVVLAIAMIVPLIMKPTPQNLFFLLGTFAVAIGFAFKDYVSSLIAGVIAVFEKPYRVGDRVRIDDIYGEVRLIGFRAVKIVTPDDTAVIIPHSKIWNSSIQNANDGQLELALRRRVLSPSRARRKRGSGPAPRRRPHEPLCGQRKADRRDHLRETLVHPIPLEGIRH